MGTTGIYFKKHNQKTGHSCREAPVPKLFWKRILEEKKII
jgi:hypothetical protein